VHAHLDLNEAALCDVVAQRIVEQLAEHLLRARAVDAPALTHGRIDGDDDRRHRLGAQVRVDDLLRVDETVLPRGHLGLLKLALDGILDLCS
jgi:hypothetical protein